MSVPHQILDPEVRNVTNDLGAPRIAEGFAHLHEFATDHREQPLGLGGHGLAPLHALGDPSAAGLPLAAYGRNVTHERYDNARLNTGDCVRIMLSNDTSEFGIRFTKNSRTGEDC